MAKTTAPLLSMGASGQIGKTQVMSTWRGVKYARRYVTPANPKSAEQTKTRGVFAWLAAVWKLLDANAQAPWTDYAKGKPLTNRNAFSKFNLAGLRGTTEAPVTTLANMMASPGSNGGLPVDAFATADATGHHLTGTITVPDLPTGWTAVKSHILVLKQQDAKTDQYYTSFYADHAADGSAIDINVAAAGTYAVFGWIDYTKPDGTKAYGPSSYKQQVIA